MSVARRITQALVEADWLESAQKQRFTQLLIEADHLEPVATRITQLMLEVDTRPPPVRAECHIVELTQTKDAYERISRIYPYGGGTGTERVTLAAATVSAATGYTMDTTNNYLEYDAAPSRIDATVTWGDIGTQDDENATDASASNTLYYAAYNYLRQRITANEVYSLRVVGLDVIAYPGETMRVTFYRYVDGWQAVGIDDDTLNILEATTEITPDGVRTVAMQLSTAEMWPDSDAGVAVDLERRVANLERGGGIALGRIGGGTGDGGSLPGTNSADSTNEVADGLHTHQMDASSDPGAAEELLKTNASGYLDLVRLYLDALHAETGADLTVQLGDNAGAQALSITDSDGAEVASIDSDGNATFTGITASIALADLSDVTATAPSDNDVLSWDDGTSAWVAAAAGSGNVATDTIWGTKGDLVVATGPNHAVRLAVGTDTHVLTADSSEAAGVKWAASASGFANPMTTAGDIIFGTAGGTAVRLGIGTAGQVLKVNAGATAPEWGDESGGVSDLDDLADVDAPAPSDNDALFWNDDDGEWQPHPIVAVGVASYTQGLDYNQTTGGTYTWHDMWMQVFRTIQIEKALYDVNADADYTLTIFDIDNTSALYEIGPVTFTAGDDREFTFPSDSYFEAGRYRIRVTVSPGKQLRRFAAADYDATVLRYTQASPTYSNGSTYSELIPIKLTFYPTSLRMPS